VSALSKNHFIQRIAAIFWIALMSCTIASAQAQGEKPAPQWGRPWSHGNGLSYWVGNPQDAMLTNADIPHASTTAKLTVCSMRMIHQIAQWSPRPAECFVGRGVNLHVLSTRARRSPMPGAPAPRVMVRSEAAKTSKPSGN